MSDPQTNGQWYVAIAGRRYGPFSADKLAEKIAAGQATADTLVFGPGVATWTPLKHVAALRDLARAPGRRAEPPELPAARGAADEIDFRIVGDDTQFVEIELDPGESAIAEAGSMFYMSDGIVMNTVFGDGRGQDQSFMDKLVSSGKRVLTGESLFMTVFTNRGAGKQHVAFAAPYSGTVVPVDLRQLGGTLICQKDSFLCAARGVSIDVFFQQRFGVGLFGGEGFIMQRLSGEGLAFIHAGGTLHPVELAAGETLRVDTGCIVGLQPSVQFEVQFVGGFRNTLFGGEGLFFATLRGPGRVWLQSLPFSRLAGRIYGAARGKRVEEGSVLDAVGSLGRLIDGG